jgi:nitrogen fixation protein NifU and related proteins
MTETADISRFYRDTVLLHSRNPQNFGVLDPADASSSRQNALCGDEVSVYLRMTPAGEIGDARFSGQGCAISMASASIMTGLIHGATRTDADELARSFEDHLSQGVAWTPPPALAAIAEVRAYPARVRCALLPWLTLVDALSREKASR